MVLDIEKFIKEQIKNIEENVGSNYTISALSGGVDSSVVAVLAYEAGIKIGNYFVDDFFRKKDEYKFIKNALAKRGIDVKCYDAKERMFNALEGISDNDKKRPIFIREFYGIFGELIKQSKATHLFQGTNKADEKMFEKGQLQHNVGVPFQEYGIKHVVEPVKELYKHEIREVARAIGLPKEISERAPFPGPGLVIRCLGEITKEKIELIREGLAIAEEELDYLNPFQVIVAISGDKVCSMIDRAIPDKYMLIIRAVKSKDAMTAEGIIPSQELKAKLEEKLIDLSSNKVGRVLWDSTNKPKGTIEYI